MNRRSFSASLALVPVACMHSGALAQAGDKPGAKQQEPARPFRSVNVPEDGRRVLFFFDFACSYCAKYHQPLINWAATVPSKVQTMFVPVVNMADVARKREHLIAAKCFYAAHKVASRDQMMRFVGSVYESYQGVGSLADKGLWAKAVSAAGINSERFVSEIRSNGVDLQIQYAARKTLQYALRATPSVAVGGKYVMTPEDVLGDEQMFFNILNGLTSEIL